MSVSQGKKELFSFFLLVLRGEKGITCWKHWSCVYRVISSKIHCGVCRNMNCKSALLTTLLFLLSESITMIKMFVIYLLPQRALSVELHFHMLSSEEFHMLFGGVFCLWNGTGQHHWFTRISKFCLVRPTQFREEKLYRWIWNVAGFAHCLPTAIIVPSKHTAWVVTKHSTMGSCSYS